MKTLNIITKLLFFLFITILFQINSIFGFNYEVRDSLIVYAKNGLNFRTTPSLNGDKVGLIPFGSQIQVVDTKQFEIRDTFDGFSGNWIEIDYLGLAGFVFDGYLSKFPIPKPSYKTGYLGDNLSSYIAENYEKKIELNTAKPCNDSIGKECDHGQIIGVYGENIVYTVAYGWERVEYNFHFRNTRFSEMINLLFFFTDDKSPMFETLDKKIDVGFDHVREIKHHHNDFFFSLFWDERDCLISM